MLGRPVLLSIAAAIGSLLSVSGASAGCYSCGCSTPVVYASPCASYYSAPMVYAAPPMYVINQGPAYTLPVPIAAEPTPAYSYPYVGANAYYQDDEPSYAYPRMHRHWRHSYGYDRGYRLDRWRHHGRPHIGMRRFYGESFRRFAHVPRAHMNMPRHLRHMHMRPHMRGPMPGFVHPKY